MSERRLRAVVGALAGTGAALAAYLVAVRLGHSALYCPTSGCETVQSSRSSELLGIPVAALGLVSFLAILATSFSRARLAVELGAGVALSSLAFAVYLLVVQLAVIHAVCVWCVGSDAIVLLLAGGTVARLRMVSAS
jgi:uncharacterized membrane protein